MDRRDAEATRRGRPTKYGVVFMVQVMEAVAANKRRGGGIRRGRDRRSLWRDRPSTTRKGPQGRRTSRLRHRERAHVLGFFKMIAPETFTYLDNITKRAGHLWRFL